MLPEGKQILLVDSATEAGETLALLRGMGLRVTHVTDPTAALEGAAREEFDLMMLGVGLAGDGLSDLLLRFRQMRTLPAIVLLARSDEIQHAIRRLPDGADDYLLKPLTEAEVSARVGRILVWRELDERVGHLQKELSRKYLLGNLVARSEGMKRVRDQVLQVAAARSTVLILGESGVGKELVAKAIHYNSTRREAPFIAINCSAIPVTLIESELFGHERGAFTGAVERRKGKFELADRGTLFLDEIGEMDLQTQSKLLRVLEEREFMRVGGGREVRVDVRVLAATNSDLEGMVRRRAFREDLYFRLKVISIQVPPLRDRFEDLPDLSRLFLQQICRDNAMSHKRMTPKAVRVLQRYAWPGNVRELKNVLESTIITKAGEVIRSSDFPAAVRGRGTLPPRARPRFGSSLEEAERDLIRSTLRHLGGNRTHAARALRIGVRTLQRKLKTYAIRIPSKRRRRAVPGQKLTETPRPGRSMKGRT